MGGCVAAGWLKVHRPDLTVMIIEPGPLGGSFKGGGLKYLRWDDGLAQLLVDNSLPALKQQVIGGVATVGPDGSLVACDYPGDLDPLAIKQLQLAHYKMTRGTMEGFTDGVMNFGGRDQFKIVTPANLCESLTSGAAVIQAMITRIMPSRGSSYLKLSNGVMVEAKTTLWTPHLLFLSNMMGDPVDPQAKLLNVMSCEAISDWWAAHDYIYTSTSCSRVHRISTSTPVGTVVAEWNGEDGLSNEVLTDLDALGMMPQYDTHKSLPGHLLPLSDGDKATVSGWLDHGIRPLGRFAEWDGRATVDKNIIKLEEIFNDADR